MTHLPVIFYVLGVLLFISYYGAFGMLCYNCQHLTFSRFCQSVQECGPHEVCFTDTFVATTGEPYTNMGCRDKLQCVGGTVIGKRDIGDIEICSECCDKPWCQSAGCGQVGLSTDRGPICYHCDEQEPNHLCSTITECSRDDVCFESMTPSTLGHPVYRSGCFPADGCNNTKQLAKDNPVLFARQFQCFTCCEKDACNTDCKRAAVIATPTPPPSAATTRSCSDVRSPAFCQMAMTQVCTNSTKAQNAGCLATCGFCKTP